MADEKRERIGNFLSNMEYLLAPPRYPQIYVPPLPSEQARDALIDQINAFEAQLDPQQELGARLVNFGGQAFYIEDVEVCARDLIAFLGHNELGQPVRLLQHVSQISVLLVAMKTRHPEPVRVGFKLAEKRRSETPGE